MTYHKEKLLTTLTERYPENKFTFEGNDPLRLHIVIDGKHTPVRVQSQKLINDAIAIHDNSDVETEVIAATLLEVARHLTPEEAAWR